MNTKTMGQGNKRWIIRDASGRIDGPFTTEKILYKIGRGEFSGEESVSIYPDGKWVSISQEADFYDKLLEVLSAEDRAEAADTTDIQEFTRPQEATRIDVTVTPPPNDEREASSDSVTGVKSDGMPDARRKKKHKRRHEDIELIDMRPKS
ncbi:MAG: hypothetical protein HC902_08690 [Calothrix sp. SM1_5_4]|nr:hypothetical protein [Calothrix sp. SM1_5_4]